MNQFGHWGPIGIPDMTLEECVESVIFQRATIVTCQGKGAYIYYTRTS